MFDSDKNQSSHEKELNDRANLWKVIRFSSTMTTEFKLPNQRQLSKN